MIDDPYVVETGLWICMGLIAASAVIVSIILWPAVKFLDGYYAERRNKNECSEL